MPNIKEYSPSFDKIALPDAGSSAWETTGRHLGATYARMVADEKQQGKVIADILMQNKLYEAAVEPAATGGGTGKKAAAAGGGFKTKSGSGDDFNQFKDWNKGFGSGSGGGSDAAATGTGIASALVGGKKGTATETGDDWTKGDLKKRSDAYANSSPNADADKAANEAAYNKKPGTYVYNPPTAGSDYSSETDKTVPYDPNAAPSGGGVSGWISGIFKSAYDGITSNTNPTTPAPAASDTTSSSE